MPSSINQPPPTDNVMAMIQGELSSKRRWIYRIALSTITIATLAFASFWFTEPEPLPTLTNVLFGILMGICLCWIAVFTWILLCKKCPSAIDRIATGWMASLACGISLVVSVVIAIARDQLIAALVLGIIGTALLGVAILLLRSAYAFRDQLRSQLK